SLWVWGVWLSWVSGSAGPPLPPFPHRISRADLPVRSRPPGRLRRPGVLPRTRRPGGLRYDESVAICGRAFVFSAFTAILFAQPSIFPLKHVPAGPHGTARTVFTGSRVEQRDVAIL